VRAAVALADAEGAEAVSMRRVAAALGAGAMSLYWHVPDKEALVDLMFDHVFGELDLPPQPSGDWKADLRRVAIETRRVFLRHPWLIPLTPGRLPLGPNFLDHAEFSMSALERLPGEWSEKVVVPAVVDDFVIGSVFREWEEAARAGQGEGEEARWRAAVEAFGGTTAGPRYPTLARLLAAESVGEPPLLDDEARFRFGLDCLLDGIATRLAEIKPVQNRGRPQGRRGG